MYRYVETLGSSRHKVIGYERPRQSFNMKLEDSGRIPRAARQGIGVHRVGSGFASIIDGAVKPCVRASHCDR